jgi:hypothetical protein
LDDVPKLNEDPVPIIVMEDKSAEESVEAKCDVSHMTCSIVNGKMQMSHQTGENNADHGQFFCKIDGHNRLDKSK